MTKQKMTIEYVPIGELKPSEYNPRFLNEREAKDLERSLKEFDFAEPIVVNRNKDRYNIIVGGHQRFYLAQQMGYSEIPCVFVDLPLEKEQELNLRLNKNLGSWDFDMLANFNETMLLNVGFQAQELYDIFQKPMPPVMPDLQGGDVETRSITVYYSAETMAEVEAVINKFDGRTVSDKLLALIRSINTTPQP